MHPSPQADAALQVLSKELNELDHGSFKSSGGATEERSMASSSVSSFGSGFGSGRSSTSSLARDRSRAGGKAARFAIATTADTTADNTNTRQPPRWQRLTSALLRPFGVSVGGSGQYRLHHPSTLSARAQRSAARRASWLPQRSSDTDALPPPPKPKLEARAITLPSWRRSSWLRMHAPGQQQQPITLDGEPVGYEVSRWVGVRRIHDGAAAGNAAAKGTVARWIEGEPRAEGASEVASGTEGEGAKRDKGEGRVALESEGGGGEVLGECGAAELHERTAQAEQAAATPKQAEQDAPTPRLSFSDC